MTDEDRKALVATMYDFSFRFGGLTFFGFKEGEMPAGIDRAAHQIEEDGKRIETQAREIERLREALRMIAYHVRDENDPYEEDYWGCRSIARAALGEGYD